MVDRPRLGRFGRFRFLPAADRLVEDLLHLRGGEDFVELDVRLDLERLVELLDRLVPLLEALEGHDADVDVRARGDRVVLEPRLGQTSMALLSSLRASSKFRFWYSSTAFLLSLVTFSTAAESWPPRGRWTRFQIATVSHQADEETTRVGGESEGRVAAGIRKR